MKLLKKCFAILLIMLLVISGVPASIAGLDDQIIKLPDGFHFTGKQLIDDHGNTQYYIESEASKYGYIYGIWVDENGDTISKTPRKNIRRSAISTSYPSFYDARQDGLITPVEQQTGGTCWAHAACAVMEANLIKKGYAAADSIDLDEYYLVWFGKNSYAESASGSRYDGYTAESDLLNGGNSQYVANATLSFSGPVEESRFEIRTLRDDDKRNSPEEEDTLRARMQTIFTTQTRFQHDYVNTRIIDISADPSEIKKNILNYGAVEFSYYADDDFNSAQFFLPDDAICAYYSASDDSVIPNHAVTVIGWDDTFNKNHFSGEHHPSVDGAWLCKNSWSPSWGNDGYFWLSYEEPVFDVVTYEMEQNNTFETVNSYNGLPVEGGTAIYRTLKARSAGAVFTVDSNLSGTQYLRKVFLGISGKDNGSIYSSYNYSFKVYNGFSSSYSSPVRKNNLIYSQKGTTVAGKPFIDVFGDVPLQPGERYSVVFDLYDAYGTTFDVYCEVISANGSGGFHLQSSPRETYYLNTSGSWRDTSSNNSNNLFLSAATSSAHSENPTVTFTCHGGHTETVATQNGVVKLPEKEGYSYSFVYNDMPFDGSNVTHDMTVLTHCWKTDGTPMDEAPCTKIFRCIWCNELMADNKIIHNYTDKKIIASALAKNASCSSPASYYYSCTDCGMIEQNDDHTFFGGDPLPHDFTRQTVDEKTLRGAATCESPASYYYSCAVCDTVDDSDDHYFLYGESLQHTFTKEIVSADTLQRPADCDTPASYYYSCKDCGAIERNDAHTFRSGDALGHAFFWVTDMEATCGKAGIKHEKCTRCDTVRNENTIIPATGAHTYTKQSATDAALKSAADCEIPAIYYYSCVVCDTVEHNDSHIFRNGAALGHTTPDSSGKCVRCQKQIAEPQRDPNACPYCGEVHGGLFGWLVRLLHNILFRIRGTR